MFLRFLYPVFKFILGTIYPAYKTWKALKRKDETTRRRWMKYWVSYSAFQLVEVVADLTLAFILPLYFEIKLGILFWLVSGTKLIFDSIINIELARREKSIDSWLLKVKKIRDRFVTVIWIELSRCSIQIVTKLATGLSPVPLAIDDEPVGSGEEEELQQAEVEQVGMEPIVEEPIVEEPAEETNGITIMEIEHCPAIKHEIVTEALSPRRITRPVRDRRRSRDRNANAIESLIFTKIKN